MSDIVQVVFKKGVLFDINISRWSALHQMKTGDLMLEKLNRKVIYPGHKKLLPEEAGFKLQHLEGKIRTFVAKRSMPFPIEGVVFITFKALPDMLKGLSALKAEFLAAAQELYDDFESIKAKQIEVLDDESHKVAVQNGLTNPLVPADQKEILKIWLAQQHAQHIELYPAKKDLLAKYGVAWRMFKVNPLGDADAELLNDEDAQVIVEQQKKLKEDMEAWVKQKAVEMHKKLGQAAAQAKKMLAENGKLNPKNLKPLFSAFEEFQAVDFAGSAFASSVQGIKAKYLGKGATMQDVAASVNASSEQFDELLSTLSDLAVDAVAQKAGVTALANSEFQRVVEV
jgi:hypothetical protein